MLALNDVICMCYITLYKVNMVYVLSLVSDAIYYFYIVESHEPLAHGVRAPCSWKRVFRDYPSCCTCISNRALS